MQTFIFDVTAMSCSGCTDRVQRTLSKLNGVSQAQVTLSPAVATVVADDSCVTASQIESAINNLGYAAKIRASD